MLGMNFEMGSDGLNLLIISGYTFWESSRPYFSKYLDNIDGYRICNFIYFYFFFVRYLLNIFFCFVLVIFHQDFKVSIQTYIDTLQSFVRMDEGFSGSLHCAYPCGM